MSGDTERTVALTRTGSSLYRATNVRGTSIQIGDGSTDDFTPVELLLVALAGCTALTVDPIVERRADRAAGARVLEGMAEAAGGRRASREQGLALRQQAGVVGGSGDAGRTDARDQGQRRREREEGTADDDAGPKARAVRRRQA